MEARSGPVLLLLRRFGGDAARCFLKLGEWQLSLQGINESTIPKVLQYYSHSTEHDRNWYKDLSKTLLLYTVPAVQGFFRSISLSRGNNLQDTLSIQRYAVIPLSTNSGLIGWVPHCDTLHALIRDYREKKKILLNIEHRIMLRMAPDYDHLTLMEKVEVFEHAVNNTAGDDLAKLLWLKSPSSEVWFDRRTNYTRSLAVMSMVGYILGLGD
ncbi:hypothetical protein CRUP_032800, partial [Coryphaenoides rupestris]